MNTAYEVTDDDRLGRKVRRRVERQVADLEAANEEQDWIEEEVNSAELPAEVAENLEEEHRRHVDMQRAQLAVDAQRSDEASDAAAAVAAEPPRLYVKRGSRHYAPGDKAKLHTGRTGFHKTSRRPI